MKSSISRMTLREIKKSKVIQPPKQEKSMVFIIILYNSRFKHSAIVLSFWTSLVAQWIRILPMQGTGVWSLVWEDLTCHRATKPEHHNYWTYALQQEKPPQWEAHTPQESSPCSPQLEKAHMQQQDLHRPKKHVHAAMKRNELLTNTKHGWNLEDIMLNERNLT